MVAGACADRHGSRPIAPLVIRHCLASFGILYSGSRMHAICLLFAVLLCPTGYGYSSGLSTCQTRPNHGSESTDKPFAVGAFVDKDCGISAPQPWRYTPGSANDPLFICTLPESSGTTARGQMLFAHNGNPSSPLSVSDGGRLDAAQSDL